MSRIGKREIKIPKDVQANVDSKNLITIEGPLGKTSIKIPKEVKVVIKDDIIKTLRKNEQKHSKQLHGTMNSLIFSMVMGVTKGFRKELEIKGVGYKAILVDEKHLEIMAGYSHPVILDILDGVKIEVQNQTQIIVTGIDKQKVGQMAALIRNVRRPNPYTGKGIMYKDEQIRRKAGKTVVAAGK